MDKSEKISWFEQFKIACLKPSQYKRLLNLAKGKVILFLAAITLITTILGYGMDVAGFTVSVGGWKNFILNRLPAFELKDGTLSVDQEMDFEIGGVHFVADTSKDKVSTIFITMLTYFNQRTRMDRKNREDVSFGKIFKLSIYARVIFELVETIGVTAGSAIFTGMAWMFISYFGSYQLLLAGFMRPEDRQKPDEML